MLERAAVVGGAAVTEEFLPGFRNSVASYTVSLLNPKIIRDLRLQATGCGSSSAKIANFLPLPDGRYLQGRRRPDRGGGGEILGEAMPSGSTTIQRGSTRSPTCCASWCSRRRRTSPAEGWRASAGAAEGRAARPPAAARSTRRRGASCSSCSRNRPATFSTAGSRAIRSRPCFGFDGIVGNYAEPLRAGHRLRAAAPRLRRGERQEGRLGPRHRRHGRDHAGDGEGCAARGVEIRTDAAVREVIVEKGRAVGVVTETGERSAPGVVVSNLNPKLLFTRLIDPAALLDRTSCERIAHWRSRLRHLPHERCALRAAGFLLPARARRAPSTTPPASSSAPSLAYMDRAFLDAQARTAGRSSRSSRC